MDFVNIFFEFFTGAPTDPEEALEYAEQGNVSGVRQIHRWYGNSVWGLKNGSGVNILNIALQKNNEELTRFCVANGAVVRFKELRYTLEKGLHHLMKILLESQTEHVNSLVDRGTLETILIRALKLGDLEASRFILPRCSPAILNQKSNVGDYALKVIVQENLMEFLAEFLAFGGPSLKLHRADENGWTALHLAAQLGKAKIIKQLLNAGASPTATLSNGKTPLHLSAEKEDHKSIQVLLTCSKFIVVEAYDADGNSPLHSFLRAITGPSKADDIEPQTKLSDQVLENFKLFLTTELKNKKNSKTCNSVFMKNKSGKTVFDMSKNHPQLMDILVHFISNENTGSLNTQLHKNAKTFQLQICSDLHLEFGHKMDNLVIPKAPYLALLGDIGVVKRKKNEYRTFLIQMASLFEKVFVVLGNHELYFSVVDEAFAEVRQICSEHHNLILLHKSSCFLEEHKISLLGTPLWANVPPLAQLQVQNLITDYSKILTKGEPSDYPFKGGQPLEEAVRPIKVEDTNYWHLNELEWLRGEMRRIQEENAQREEKVRVVVLTHHSPLMENGSSNAETWGQETNYAFSTDLMHLMGGDVVLWGYGHTHWFQDMVFNGTRVVSNPHGYGTKAHFKSYYDPEFVVNL